MLSEEGGEEWMGFLYCLISGFLVLCCADMVVKVGNRENGFDVCSMRAPVWEQETGQRKLSAGRVQEGFGLVR